MVQNETENALSDCGCGYTAPRTGSQGRFQWPVVFLTTLLLADSATGAGTTRLPAAPDPVADHLAAGRAYLERGEYAKAVLEFEQVLSFDNLPPDLREQAEIYDRAARNYTAGQRLSGFGYAETGGGYYHENSTESTDASGGDPARDTFWIGRAGGGLSYIAANDITLDGNLDYRYRRYDDSDRRDDSDLRWRGVVNRTLPNGSQAIGVRGRASYRGSDGYRHDYGLFVNQAFNLNADNRLALEAEIRARNYPSGSESDRDRNIGELSLGWTRALLDGHASVTLTANGGHEWATNDRPDGDKTFYGANIDFSMDLNEHVGFFLFAWWEHNAFDEDRAVLDENHETLTLYTRSDDLYELSGGLTWEFAHGWSLRPEVVYLRDDSNTVWGNYSSTEVWTTVRKSF
jgi:hypothetical protein